MVSAALAVMTTFGASATGFVTWLIWDAIKGKKPSVVGAAIGAVIGLVAITPAASFVTPLVSLLFGFVSVTASYWILLSKEKLPFDDVLDVFACHGVGGIVGALMTGMFAYTTGSGNASTIKQVGIQSVGILSIAIYAAIVTAIILYVVKAIFGLRINHVDDENFNYSIDEIIHGELGYGEFTKIKKAEEEGNL
jgi:Amt family ammonium transporter